MCQTFVILHVKKVGFLCMMELIASLQNCDTEIQTNHVTFTCDCVCDAGDSTCGQRALYQLGLTGIPMYNVSCL